MDEAELRKDQRDMLIELGFSNIGMCKTLDETWEGVFPWHTRIDLSSRPRTPGVCPTGISSGKAL